jgi:peptide/nickel transport system ATP-binding protein
VLSVENIDVRRGIQRVLNRVSLAVLPKQTLAVVGQSGAGKSTLISAILDLVEVQNGRISWSNAPVRTCCPALVMQEPRAAFNPHLSLRRSVLEPIVAQGIALAKDRLEKLCDGLELSPDLLERGPRDVSIGQAQRIGVLRALIAAPPLVLFDEPLSALDAITQKRTARLIADLQREEGFAALIVTHDLGYAAAYADEVAVLRAGRIEEMGPPDAFVEAPKTAYGRVLRDAAFALGALEKTG